VAGDDVTIRVRAEASQAMRTFAAVASSGITPLAAAMVPLAAKAGAAGAAVGALGIAVAGQVGKLSEAAKAQETYNKAVVQYGQGSKQAAEAQRAMQTTLDGMPQATQRASVALATLKGTFSDFSDSTASFTMVPVEKSFTVLGQLIPELTGMATGAASQLDRLVTVAGGAVASPGFDALADKFSTFANESLKEVVDGVIHFARVLSEGEASGPVQSFMEFAEANGPALQETLANVGDAVQTLVEASAEAGPGMLTLVNAGLQLVAALPPELVATVMQLAVGLKLVTLAGAGAAAVAGGITTLGASIAGLRVASAAAGGGMAGLAAAFGTLGTAAKATLIASGIGILVVALASLSDMGKKAPPDVDKLTGSLRTLGQTGKVAGEAARVFGKDLSGFADALQKVTDPKGLDQVQQSIVSFFGTDSTPVKEAKENIDGLDKALAGLVKSGQADIAADALDTLVSKMKEQGFSADEIRGRLDDYKSALADAKFEQELAAQSMGIFGAAAQDTSAKLEAQKGAADGLRASILALNDVNRSAHDAQTQFGEALDSLTESFREHGATLSADTEAGRANRDAMSAAAAAQDELLASGIAAGDSLGSMTKKSSELREEMMRLATEAFKGNTEKAREYVDALIGTPGEIKTLVKLEREEAIAGLEEVISAISATPDAKTVTVETLNGAAIQALEDVGLKTKQLPDGKTAVYTANGKALGSIEAVLRALNNLNGKTANTYVNTYRNYFSGVGQSGSSVPVARRPDLAQGGRVRGYAGGGDVQAFPNGGYVQGPGSPTSDSVLAFMGSGAMAAISDTEYVVKAAAVRKYGVKMLDALNNGQLPVMRLAGGGVTKKEAEARKAAASDLTISYFGQMAGFKTTEFAGALGKADSVGELVGALNKWRSVIKQTTHGVQESKLLKMLKTGGDDLIRNQKALAKVTASLEKARDKLDKLKDAASQLDASVKGGIISGASITRAATAEEGQVTINTLLSQARGDAAQADAFADALKQLEKKGVSGRIIEQIAEAGISGGGLETAQALLGADKGQITELNKLNQSIRQSADDAGEYAADALYGAGIKAAEGLVEGLKKKQDKIEEQMLKIAKSMEKAIKEALGIKSPSTVMMRVGDQTAEGFALGIVKNRSVRPAWESMLNAPRGGVPRTTLPAGTAGGAPAGSTAVIQLQIGDTQLGEVMIDPVRRAVKTRGGLRAVFGGLD